MTARNQAVAMASGLADRLNRTGHLTAAFDGSSNLTGHGCPAW